MSNHQNEIINEYLMEGGIMKHTPTPWKVKKITPAKMFGKTHSHMIGQDVEGCIADIYKENGKENAKIIVKAVNNHGRLINALTWAIDNIENNVEIDLEEIKEVLKQAESEE